MNLVIGTDRSAAAKIGTGPNLIVIAERNAVFYDYTRPYVIVFAEDSVFSNLCGGMNFGHGPDYICLAPDLQDL